MRNLSGFPSHSSGNKASYRIKYRIGSFHYPTTTQIRQRMVFPKSAAKKPTTQIGRQDPSMILRSITSFTLPRARILSFAIPCRPKNKTRSLSPGESAKTRTSLIGASQRRRSPAGKDPPRQMLVRSGSQRASKQGKPAAMKPRDKAHVGWASRSAAEASTQIFTRQRSAEKVSRSGLQKQASTAQDGEPCSEPIPPRHRPSIQEPRCRRGENLSFPNGAVRIP